MNLPKIEEGMRLVLEGLGVDLNDHNFNTTPQRAAKVFQEIFQPAATQWPVFDEDFTDMVIMRGHEFWTMCPHHLLPVRLISSVAYIPNGKVIGASKLIRMIHEVNTMPMTQEKLTAEIVKSIDKLTEGTSAGSAVWLRGEHGCFRIRGTRSSAELITCKFSGQFEEKISFQERFFRLVGGLNGNGH